MMTHHTQSLPFLGQRQDAGCWCRLNSVAICSGATGIPVSSINKLKFKRQRSKKKTENLYRQREEISNTTD